MNDLIFVFNDKESKKNGLIVLESYICNNKVNAKNKYVGGIIRKVNIYDYPENSNFAKAEFEEMLKLFREASLNVSYYQYIMKIHNLCRLFKHFCNKKIFYFTTYKNDINLIMSYREEESFISKKKDILCEIPGYNLWYAYRSNELVILENGTAQKQFVTVPPIPKMVIKDNEFYLLFAYGKIEVEWGSTKFLYEYNGKIIVRNYNAEAEYEKKVQALGFRRKKANCFQFGDIVQAEELLVCNGFNVETYNYNKENQSKVHVKLLNTKNDWFDLKLYVEYDNRTVELGGLIDLFSNKKSVLIGKDRIDIPSSIIENAQMIIQDKEGLRVPKKNFWTLLQIAAQTQIDFSEFVSYENVSVSFDSKIENELLNYQRMGTKWLKWLYLNQLGGCLADDMGVGKTFQTIAFLLDTELKDSIRKVLIIVPYVLLTNWVREFAKFSNEDSIMIYHGEKRKKVLEADNRIMITTYATAACDISDLKHMTYDVIIFDEVQQIKNSNSKTYKALMNLNALCRVGLSGTPLENRIDELWNVLSMLNPGMFFSKRQFIQKYRRNEVCKLIAPFILRRTKEEVLGELPEKSEEILYCDFEDKQRELYNAIKIAVKNSSQSSYGVNNGVMLKGLLMLREVCCHPSLLEESINIKNIKESCKFDALKLKVEEIVLNGHKVVIFSQFTNMLHIIEAWCQEERYKYYYLDGQTKKRQAVIDAFEEAKEGIFLISLKAGGVGLNLTSAHYAILYEPWWNPFAEHQAEDRLFRIGQKKNVCIYKLIISDSIEEKILDLQKSKLEMFGDVMEGMDSKVFDIKEFIESL